MNSRNIKYLGGPTDDGDAANKNYVDTENKKQDIAINDKASKSYVDSEMLNFYSINTGLGYNDPVKNTFSYEMNNFIHISTQNFIFDGNVVSSIANTRSNANNTLLSIPYKGKYKIIFRDTVSLKGYLKIDLLWVESSGQKVKNVYSEYFDFVNPDPNIIDWVQISISFDFFVDNSNSNLKIYSTEQLLLDGSQSFHPGFFGLYLDSDVLRKREAANTYLN